MKILKISILYFFWLSRVSCLSISNADATSSEYESVIETRATTFQILDFWKKHENDFQISTQRDIILLLGSSGARMTTTSLFLTDADLESIDLYDYRYNIIDKNGRIGHNYHSRTFVPELIIDPETGAAFYDCPGFQHTRGLEHDVATAYFMNKLINSANSIKLVFTISHDSVKPGEPIQALLNIIAQAHDLIGNLGKFSDGIAMIVTKVKNHFLNRYGTSTLEDDTTTIKSVVDVLKYTKRHLTDIIIGSMSMVYRREFLEGAIQFVDILLEKQNDKYQRIGIFRGVSEEGPLNSMDLFQNEKTRLKEIIHKNINYVPIGDTEFGYPIVDRTRREIGELIKQKIIREELVADVWNICDEIKQFYLRREEESVDINALQDELRMGIHRLSGIGAEDARVFVNLIIDAANDLGIELSYDTLNLVSKHIENVDFLTKVTGLKSPTSVELENELKSAIEEIRSSQEWYDFLVYLKGKLSGLDPLTNDLKDATIQLQRNCLIDGDQQRNVSEIGLAVFLNLADVGRYADVRYMEVNSNELKALHSVLNVLWQSNNSVI